MRLLSSPDFICLVLAPSGILPIRLLRAAERADALGIASLGAEDGPAEIAALAAGLRAAGAGRFGLQFEWSPASAEAIEAAGEGLAAIVVGEGDVDVPALADARRRGVRIYCEVTGWSDRLRDLEPSVDGLILKGHECGGLVGEQTTFILLQDLRRRTRVPLLARGGITPETAAAARVAGAAGVVLDDQVLLLAESPVQDPALRRRLGACSGAETTLVQDPSGPRYLRALVRPGSGADAKLAERLRVQGEAIEAVGADIAWPDGDALPLGQTVGLAAVLGRRYRTLGRLIGSVRTAATRLPGKAAERKSLMPGGPLATSLGTTYPILQGPMTRVSDVAPFIARVGEAGALPFAALALLRGEQSEALLREIDQRLGDRPWGVGLLGFAHTEILREQMVAVEKYQPKFAIIAGGRVNQVLGFEAKGIRTFVHSSTPALLTHYLDEGVRRFIVEGRECGGHIGPLSSFVLWSSVVEALRDHPVVARSGGSVELVFAGGIHDAVSAAMVATIVEPLAARGVKVGVLMGTAYLFTREIVEAGAIVPDYQEVAVACAETLTLSEGGGFASRCAVTPIADDFRARRRELEEAGATAREVREQMEMYSLGRLRMATKGVARVGPDRTLTSIDPEQRRAEGMYMIGQAATLRDQVASLAELHENVTTAALEHLASVARAESEEEATAGPPPADVAIVGMATLLPGADSLAAYWRRILSGESAIREIPQDRWSPDAYFHEDRSARDKVYSRRGGFIDDVAFDPLAYGIPPASLPSIDPMQLLALEVVGDALTDADIRPDDDIDRSRISVVFGFSGGMGELGAQYAVRSELPRLIGEPSEETLGRLPEWTQDSFAGILPNVAAGRIANRFDFGGSNQTVDAACASSLAAVYSGVLELESGRADVVIAGGLDTLQSPFGYLCFSKTNALSPRGVCNTFDSSADGIVISEGLAAVALKRLADAERDGDRIYAVIKGVGASSDGRAKGLTAPLPTGQKRALRRAYRQAGFGPSTVQLFEAHGTGTVAGDRAELDTVTGILRSDGAPPRSAAIGSVKTLIGHTKAAAGLAGLIKAALGLHHRVLPPHALVKVPNAALQDQDAPIYLSQAARPWVRKPETPRRAGVSSFGFGGTNFHVALEEYGGGSPVSATEFGRDVAPIALAGEDLGALARQLRELVAGVAEGRFASVREVAAHVLSERPSGPARIGFVASSLDEVRARAGAALDWAEGRQASPGGEVHATDRAVLADGGKLAFLFPGQGSQYPDMLREATLLGPSITDTLDRAEQVLHDTPTFGGKGRRLASIVYPGDAFSPAERKAQMAALTATEVAQPALGAVEAGLLRLLAGLGVEPDMVAGHSYGEFVALHAAGAIGLDDLIRLSEARGRAINDGADPATPGAMAAVTADAEATQAALAGVEGVTLANFNSPRQTVIAGARDAISRASEALSQAGLQVHAVPVSQAFHTALMAPARAHFEAALDRVAWREPPVPVYSNTHARRHARDSASIRRVMAEHLIRPVDFCGMVRAMAADGARVWLEVGPKAVLSGRLGEILGAEPAVAIALDRSAGDGAAVLDALVQLFVCGAPVDLARLVGQLSTVTPRPAKADSKHVWLVNGAYARPSGAPRRAQDPPRRPVAAEVVVSAQPASTDPEPEGRNLPVPSASSQELEFMTATNEDLHWSGYHPDESQDVLGGYHQMMKQFLQVQERVMLAYLGQNGADERPFAPAYPPVADLSPRPLSRPEARPELRPEPVHVPEHGNGSAPPKANGSDPAGAHGPAAVQEPQPERPTNGAAHAEPTVAAAPPPPVQPGQPIDLLATFTGIIADKTGYPTDSLEPGQDLEADLGIDSIKRMEILGAFQKVLPPEVAETLRSDMDAIAEISTIREIVDYVAAKGVSGHPPTARPGPGGEAAHPFELAGEAETCAATLPRFLQVPFEEPLDGIDLAPPAGRRFAVTEAEDGFHDDVAAALAEAGASAVILPAAVLESDEPEAIAGWLSDARHEGAVDGLVHLGGRTCLPDLDTLDPAAWRRLHRRGTKALFRLLQAMAPDLRENGRFIAVSETGGLFGRALDGPRAAVSAAAGAIGIVRSISLEWPAAGSKVIDLDPSETAAERARHILAELSLDMGRREVGYPSGRRTIFRTEPHSLAPPDRAPEIGPDWVVVATGGARGITAECLRTLAPHGPTLVLVGRSAVPDPEPPETANLDIDGLRRHYLEKVRASGEKVRPRLIERDVQRHLGHRDMRRNIEDFAGMGARVDYRSVDVCDADAVAQLFDDLYDRYGRVDMVVHGAGLIEDAWLERKSAGSFDRVFDTKVDSAFLIARALRPETLRALCFFTSVAGRYGNPGQTDYAAANETLNRLAWGLKRRFGERAVVKAINWGPWAETTTGAGMVTPEVRRQFESRGIGMVEPLPGRDLFFKEMFWSDPAEVETVAWAADAEHMEEQRCALPAARGSVPASDATLLLAKAVRRENGHRELLWRFDLVNAPYIDDHRFDGVAVMPFTGVMQMLSEVPAAFGARKPVVALEDLRMFQGITLKDGGMPLRFVVEEAQDDDSMLVGIFSEVSGNRPHYRGRVRLGDRLPTSDRRPSTDAGRPWGGPGVETIYRRWLSHGPRFQTLTRITGLDESLIRAQATASRPEDFLSAGAGRQWTFDPGMIDGTLQTVWVWTRTIQGTSALPLRVQAVRRYAGEGRGPFLVEVTMLSGPKDRDLLANFCVFDASGALILEMENFGSSASEALNRLSGGWQGGERNAAAFGEQAA